MTQTLYNLRHDGEQYRVTKFVDGEVESSYLTTHSECDCPAGHRHTCRHRQMLPDLLPIADTHWFWDFAAREVVDLMGTPKAMVDALIAPLVEETVEVRSPDDVYTEKDFMVDMFAKNITPACAPAEQDTEAFNVTATEVNERIAATHMPDVDWTPELDAIIALLPAGLHGREDAEQTVRVTSARDLAKQRLHAENYQTKSWRRL